MMISIAKKFFKVCAKSLGVIVVSGAILSHIVLGETMSSNSYKIQSDSINFGGGNSVSDSYIIEDTMGEIATGISNSDHYIMNAGYQQMTVSYISVTPPTDVVMSPAIGGVTGGTSNGETSFIVVTDNPAGYIASIAASSSPALVSGSNSFEDYSPTGADPDFTFAIEANASEFGFTIEGIDISAAFKDDGASCNTGSLDTTDACWNGLSTTPIIISQRNTSNTPLGIETTLKFRASSGSNHVQPAGLYVATTTVTVLAQ